MNLTWNNNAYYFGTDAARQGVGQAGTTAGTNFYTTFAALMAYSSTLSAGGTNDNASLAFTSAVPFVSGTDLHLMTSPIPPLSGAGVSIAGITTDIDGDLRQSPPDIGADEIITYTLTYTAGANGMISGTSPQTVISGGSGTAVTAVPDTGYHFVNWSDASTDNPRTDTNVMGDISVTANFAINTYTLTYTAGANGSIVGTSPQMVNYGGDGTLVTATPDTGYHFVSWSDGYPTAARTDTNVMADVNATATFAINTYTLTYTAGANGSIVGTSPQMVNYGGDGTLVTATPDTGYHFVSWSDGYPTAARTDTNVMADVNATATFAINVSSNADLSNLVLSAGTLTPPFDPATTSYTASVSYTTTSITVTPTASDAGATITVNGNAVVSGNTSDPINLNVGNNTITTVVTAADMTTMMTYTVDVTRGAQVAVTASGGTTNASYTTVKGAFDAINTGTHTGTITIAILGDTTETASAVLNASGTGSASYTSISMSPSGGAARVVSGAITAGSPLIDLNGADNVTIDGLNTGGNALTISNTTASATVGTSTIRFIGGATNNTVTRCTVSGSSTSAVSTAGGNILFSTSTVAGGNSNNTVSFCDLGPAGSQSAD